MVAPAEAVLLEGVTSARRAVADRLTMAIWIEAPPSERLTRELARDGERARADWERWGAAEDAHFARDRARARADVLVDGAPALPHDPETEFVRLG